MQRVTVTLDDELMADHIIAERGVRHGRVVVIPADPPGAAGRGRERLFHRHA